MKLTHAHRALLLLVLLLPVLSLASCVSASSALEPVDREWRAITNDGINGLDGPTAEKLNHFGATLSQAAANATFFGSHQVVDAPKVGASPQTQPPPSAPAVVAQVTGDALTGNWPGVVNTLVAALIAGGVTVYGYKKQNAERDATSIDRTKQDLVDLGVPLPPKPALPA